ncbi:MAG: formylglycine-generating enzyme family protein [Treponema sp.]|nr:formylglycine-generating enzyme family protein [Treponema sp.]
MKQYLLRHIFAFTAFLWVSSALPAQDTELVMLEAGTFMMGSPASEVSRHGDEDLHQVMVGSFYVSRHEVTQREYEIATGRNPSKAMGASLPVENVSWFDAVLYCNARSVLEGFTPAYTVRDTEIIWDHTANGFRLPTEAEWEYACRAGTSTPFSSGYNIRTDQANYDGNFPYNRNPKGTNAAAPVPVMSYPPNPWGIYDMHGNVSEWCWDQYRADNNARDLDGSLDSPGVIRGGSWYSEAGFLRSASRSSAAHNAGNGYTGFRVVRTAF